MWFKSTWSWISDFFVPNFFNFKIILASSIFENAVASRVFNFTYFCTMPWWTFVGKIRRYPDGVEATLPVNLWDYASGGSQLVHTDAVITINPKSSSSHFSITLQTDKGYVLSTKSLYVNDRACLVGLNDHVFQKHPSYSELFITYSYKRGQDMFYTSAVGAIRLICIQFITGIPKRSRKYWCWYWIVEARLVKIRHA